MSPDRPLVSLFGSSGRTESLDSSASNCGREGAVSAPTMATISARTSAMRSLAKVSPSSRAASRPRSISPSATVTACATWGLSTMAFSGTFEVEVADEDGAVPLSFASTILTSSSRSLAKRVRSSVFFSPVARPTRTCSIATSTGKRVSPGRAKLEA